MDVIQFTPDGKAQCLYTEIIPLCSLGSMTIARASQVEWCNRRAEWQVKVKGKIVYGNASRDACLKWEHQLFNRQFLGQ